jgi:hypothetical protein
MTSRSRELPGLEALMQVLETAEKLKLAHQIADGTHEVRFEKNWQFKSQSISRQSVAW